MCPIFLILPTSRPLQEFCIQFLDLFSMDACSYLQSINFAVPVHPSCCQLDQITIKEKQQSSNSNNG